MECVQNTAVHVVLDTQHPCPMQQLHSHLHWLPVHFRINYKLECGPMTHMMAALPNIGGALCSTSQSVADAQY